jgi:hypothetical protein
VFYFVVDEIDSSQALNRFLHEILTAGGRARMRITAYAIGTKTGQVDKEIRATYEHTKLAEDLALTPAA